jgi:hypothetical protein
MEHLVPHLVIELKADIIRILDRSTANGEQSNAAEYSPDEKAPE